MTKSELKSWYGVEFRNKQRALLIDGRFYDSDGNLYAFLVYYEKNLTCNNRGLKELDIMKVVDLKGHDITGFLEGSSVFWDWNWIRTENKTGRVTLENVEVGETYYFIGIYGDIRNYEYRDDPPDREIILNNPLNAWYTEEEALTARDRHMEDKKRKEEPCGHCGDGGWEYVPYGYIYCPMCGRRLGVE